MTLPRLVVLDRDGTITESPPVGEYILDPGQLRLLPGAGEAVAKLNAAGVAVVLATNQRCVALGMLSESGLDSIHDRLAQLLAAHGARLDAVLYCPHGETGCECRKPLPGMVRAAMARTGAHPDGTVMIGDRESDIAAAHAAGAQGVLLVGGDLSVAMEGAAQAAAANLVQAVSWLLAES